MRREMNRRLAAIERRLKPPARPILEITISGGLAPGIAPIASFGDHEWEAAPGETFEAFRARASAAAQAEGLTHIVFGGFPESELIASGYLERHHSDLCTLESSALNADSEDGYSPTAILHGNAR
jgi:hypothetical protein